MTTTSSPSTLMATSAASVAARPAMSVNPMTSSSNNTHPDSNTARRRTTYNPTITAMLALSRCDEMVKMTQECLTKKEPDGLCHTAERYMSVCMKNNKA